MNFAFLASGQAFVSVGAKDLLQREVKDVFLREAKERRQTVIGCQDQESKTKLQRRLFPQRPSDQEADPTLLHAAVAESTAHLVI